MANQEFADMANRELVNRLVDALEHLFIENRAYKASLKVMAPLLPPAQPVDQVVESARNDPDLRARVHAIFASVRNQSPEEAILVLLRIVSKDRN